MKRILLVFSVFALLNCLKAQVNRNTFPLSREFKKSGFAITPLATVSFGNKSEREYRFNPDVVYNVTETGRGTWNGGLELSYLKFFEGYKVGDYFEGSLSYRRNSGVHYLDAEVNEAVSTIIPENITSEIESAWRFETATASLRVMDIAFQKPTRFLIWGLGVNYNYTFADRFENNGVYTYTDDEVFDELHSVKVNLLVGYAFKVSKFALFVPTLETPIVNLLPSGRLNPSIPIFDVEHQPLTIGLKIMLLRKDPVNCNAPQLKNMPSM